MALSGGYQVIHDHRRGYAGSGPLLHSASVAAEAADCRALMAALNVVPAHVVGVSYSAAIALTLASSAPETVRTLTVMEPPPVRVPSASQFLAANAQLLETFRANGPTVALDEFLTLLVGPDWRRESERDLPGSVEVMERDVVTFFESDMPAMLSWDFGAEEAAASDVRCCTSAAATAVPGSQKSAHASCNCCPTPRTPLCREPATCSPPPIPPMRPRS